MLILAPLGIATFAGNSPQAKWKGKIVEKDGVIMVENPKKPIYEGRVLDLIEELKIGESSGPPEYIFGRIAAIAVDGKGGIFVADDKNIHIKAFDAKGGYVRTIGREGQGPGEIGCPSDVFIDSRGELLVPDEKNYKLHFYSPLGLSLQDKSFGNRFPRQSTLGPRDELYVLSIGGGFATGTYYELAKLDKDLITAAVLHRIDIPPGPLKESLAGKVPDFCVRPDGGLVMGFSKKDEYRIEIIDPKGRRSRIITRDFDPVPIPKNLLDKVKKSRPPGTAIEIPAYFATYSRLMADDEGRIFAQTPPIDPEGKSFIWDLFDAEGRYLANVRLPGSAWHLGTMKHGLLWKVGKLYTIEENEEGFHIVKRYRAIWKWK